MMRCKMCTGMFLLGLVVWRVSSVSGAEPEQNDLIAKIAAGSARERGEAEQRILAQRQRDIEALLAIVNSPVGKNEDFYADGAKNSAIKLLGELRATEAVFDLIAKMHPEEAQEATPLGAPGALSPAARALVKIGLPAIDPLVEAIMKAATKETTCAYADVLGRIKGLEEAVAFLEREMGKVTAAKERGHLQAAITYLDEKIKEKRGIEKAGGVLLE